MNKKFTKFLNFAVAIVIIATSSLIALDQPQAHATGTITWNGGAGSWNTASKWSTGTVPTAADDVVVSSGSIMEMGSISFKSLEMSSSSTAIMLMGDIASGEDLTIKSGATLQLNSNRQTLTGDFTIESGATVKATFSAENQKIDIQAQNITVAGKIDLKGKGYAGGEIAQDGNGPGGGEVGGSYAGGGGHGGNGGDGSYSSNKGFAYCLGSNVEGGGSGGGGAQYVSKGGAGGGFVTLSATNDFTLTGTIDVDGLGTASGRRIGGAGAGGGVKITAYYVNINGTITADGGTGGYYRRGSITNTNIRAGGGGGGCIYVGY